MKSLAILGASGHGKVVAEIARLNGWKTIDFFDARWVQAKIGYLYPVIGTDDDLYKCATLYDGVFVGVGDNKTRSRISKYLFSSGVRCVSLVHPSAIISSSAKIGCGVVVMPNAVVNAEARIEDGVIINTAATVDHDCFIDAYAHLSPGVHLAGNVFVGEKSWIGIGSVVREGIKIGSDTIIGAGSVVISNIKENCTAFGVPAKYR